jgi:hypothetical protein
MQRTPFELEDWSFFGAWRLGFGGLPPPSEYQKRFVIPAAANIFRASCRSQFLAAKLVKRSRNDLRSPPAAKFCAPNRPGVICFPPRTPNASGTSARWRASIKRTKRASKPICRLVKSANAKVDRPLRGRCKINAAPPPKLTSSKGLLDPPDSPKLRLGRWSLFALRPPCHLPHRFVRIRRGFGAIKVALVDQRCATTLRSDEYY